MPVSRQSPGAWQRAATVSVIWQTIAPVRRIWLGAEAAVSRVVAAGDSERLRDLRNKEARTESIVGSSRLVRLLDRILAAVIAVWSASVAGATSRQVIDHVKARNVAGRVRLAGDVMAVASATALAMRAARPTPFTWIMPALFLFVGVCLIAVAHERPAR